MIEVFEVSEQLIHKMLYMGWGVPEAYQNDYRIFETTVIDNCETVTMVWMDEELEKEARNIDNREIILSLYRFDDILL